MILTQLVRTGHTVRTWFRYITTRISCWLGAGRNNTAITDVAIVARIFPPAYSGGVFRPVSWTRHFSDAGQSIIVVTDPAPDSPTPAGIALQAQVPQGVRVIRREGMKVLNPFQRLVPQIDGGIIASLDMTRDTIRQLKGLRPSVVVASGPPFSAFVTGYLLAQYWRRPLIIDYRDEWSECPFPFVSSGSFDRVWESRVNAFATHVVCVSHSQLEHHMRTFPSASREKCHVITNGWEPQEVAEVKSGERGGSRVLTLGFAGTLGDHTLPHRFLADLAFVIKNKLYDTEIELHFLGSQSEKAIAALAEFPVPGVIHSLGLRTKSEAHTFMADVDVLIILNDLPMARYIPGKLYDYLASGTPVLAFGMGGEIERILTETEAGIAVPEHAPEELARALRSLALRPRAFGGSRADWLARHTRANAAEEMLRLIHDAQNRSRPR